MKTSSLQRRFSHNFTLFLISLLMAFIVWAIAVNTVDPMEKRIYPSLLSLEVVNLNENLTTVDFESPKVQLVLTAPRSAWTTLINNPKLIQAYIDLSGMTEGEADIKVEARVELPAVRVDNVIPAVLHVHLAAKTS